MPWHRIQRNLELGLENLLLHKLRSLLTMLGIVFGVGSVIAMLAVGEGASRAALDRIRKLGSQNIIITSQKPVEDVQDNERRRILCYGITYQDHQRVLETLSTVKEAVPVKLLRKESRLAARTMELRLVGTTAGWFRLVQREFLAGRPLNDRDDTDHRAVTVLTEHGARKLLAANSTVGQHVRIGGNYYEVVGIVRNEENGSGGVQTPDLESDAYIPLSVARDRHGDIDVQMESGSFKREEVELHQMILHVDSTGNVQPTADAAERMLRVFHKNNDYTISVPLALLREAEQTKRTFNIVLGSIAAISLLVGGIGIMNIMLASVTERTREIGIRRAVGARKSQILTQFLIESVVLTTAGGIIGIGIGFLIPAIISAAAEMPTIITAWSILVSLVISVGVGIIFGIYPAARAADLDPITALRHE